MANRPTFIDLRSKSHGPLGTGLPSPRLPSPRLHVAGDVPPDLSPLDAFAAQSRLLARQLEESMHGGSRISRLPPLTTENPLIHRPSMFRSASADPPPGTILTPPHEGSGHSPEVEIPGYRPVSVHPQLSGMSDPPPFGFHNQTSRLETHAESVEDTFRGRRPPSSQGHGHGHPDFGARREQSPPSLDRQRPGNSPSGTQSRPNVESMRQRGHGGRRPKDVSLAMNGYDSRALAPPRSPYAQRTPSPRSTMSNDSSDDDYKNSNQDVAGHRKMSSGSGVSAVSMSPSSNYLPRSPSISSEISVGGTRLPRPAFNFSRPLSRASVNGPSIEVPSRVPSRQASSDSQPSFILADDTAHTPVSMHSEGFPDHEVGAAPSYVYSRFSLPRGKMLQRNSLIFQENLPQAQFSWEQPVPFTNVQRYNGSAPPSPPSRPSTSHPTQTRPSLDPGRPSYDPGRPSTSYSTTRPSLDPGRPSYSTEMGRASGERAESPSVASSATIKARSQHSLAPSSEASGEEHVSLAIDYHNAGALTKSTYHLRLAARQHHPTGMLLYALACRHGWGMRPNQKEGVEWLRKAADSASLEVADDEDLVKDGKTVDILERKTRKAQFALSIYELGVSHMNGWGIEQDKVLALRCFEIAGSWGDADALAEAGFCYAQGTGCKKDLKKSAALYRQAEAKGISMVGNSWIYKAKYNDDPKTQTSIPSDPRSSPEKKKARDKSRTRTMFGRKK